MEKNRIFVVCMSPADHAERKAKLLRLASDLRGNENERQLAAESYRRMCEASPPSGRPEFNRLERAIIGLGASVVFSAALLAEVIRRRAKRPRSRPQASATTA